MRALLVFVAVLASARSDILETDLLSESFLAAHPPPVNAAGGLPCVDSAFRSAQYGFNQALGINTDLDWTQATTISRAINNILTSGVDGLLSVCRARSQFYRHLGASYSQCINRYYLVGKGGSIIQAYTYVQIFNHLDFICNGGFEQAVNNWQCILRVNAMPNANACVNTFNATIHQDPNGLCPDASALLDCVRAPFAQFCGETVSWWACEDTRIGFVDYCNNLRCYVGGNSLEFVEYRGAGSSLSVNMWAVLIISVVAHLSTAQFPANSELFDFPTSVLEVELSSYASSAAATSVPCNQPLLNECQHTFNDDLGIQGVADWHDPAQLFSELGRIYTTGVAGVIKICNARIKFFQCLGETYDSCINPFTFIQEGFSLENSFAYMRAMHRLQFACGSGFQTGVQNYQCLNSVYNKTGAASALANCDQAFNQSIHEPAGQICSSLQSKKVLLCYQTQYQLFCSFSAAWYACEDIRSAVANLCPDLKCYVFTAPPQASVQQNDESNHGISPRFDAETLERSHDLGFVQRSIFQSLPELTPEQEEVEQKKAASIAEEAKRQRDGVSDRL
uniref:Uncharacterized protein n=1 Tax=Plectus sambesii TaxID=2011161 RepID=A0A914UWR9_9BILA